MSVEGSYASGGLRAANGVRSKSLLARPRLASFLGVCVSFLLAAASASGESTGVETNTPPPSATQIQGASSEEMVRAFAQLQEQLQATQIAIEQSRQETRQAAAQTAEALSNALHAIEGAFAAQRGRDLEAMQKSNKVTLIVAGTFAGVGFLTMLMVGYFQWRMSRGLAEIVAAMPAGTGLGLDSAAAALSLAEQSSLRLLGARAQQETRTHPPGHPAQSAPTARANPKAIEPRFLPSLMTPVPARPLRPIKTAVIVGLICAAVLALVFYLVTYSKLGVGILHGPL